MNDMEIILKDLPMPPSINALYANNFKSGRGRFKTSSYKKYELEMIFWAQKNQVKLNLIRQYFSHFKQGDVFEINQTFFFSPEEIFTQFDKKTKRPPRPKRQDTSNRLKALHDSLSTILGIDDSYFWSGFYDKMPSTIPDLPNYCEVTFNVIKRPIVDPKTDQ